MADRSWIIRGDRVVLPDGVRPATIYVEGGRIAAIEAESSGRSTGAAGPVGGPLIEAGPCVVLPGLVDTHVHINEPGRADWEGFETATRAAAAGGITTIVDMPLNSIPATTTVAALAAKRGAAQSKCYVDVGFWGGVVPGNAGDIEPLAAAGVLGYKCFVSPSGVAEFTHVSEADLRLAGPHVAATGLPLLVHAERPDLLREPRVDADPTHYATWLESRPPEAEVGAITLLIRVSRATGARLHIVHVASADAVLAVRLARQDGVPITAETCPHYLAFCAEDIPDRGTAWKCAPPIRDLRHQQALWRALAEGHLDLVATDHSPAPPVMKHLGDGNFLAAWGGIASLQVALPVMWTLASGRGFGIERLAAWMSAAPARLAGLSGRKGAIDVGNDADLVLFDPDRELLVDAYSLYHRHPVTPYDGARLKGIVTMTMLRGEVVYEHGRGFADAHGELLTP